MEGCEVSGSGLLKVAKFMGLSLMCLVLSQTVRFVGVCGRFMFGEDTLNYAQFQMYIRGLREIRIPLQVQLKKFNPEPSALNRYNSPGPPSRASTTP